MGVHVHELKFNSLSDKLCQCESGKIENNFEKELEKLYRVCFVSTHNLR